MRENRAIGENRASLLGYEPGRVGAEGGTCRDDGRPNPLPSIWKEVAVMAEATGAVLAEAGGCLHEG